MKRDRYIVEYSPKNLGPYTRKTKYKVLYAPVGLDPYAHFSRLLDKTRFCENVGNCIWDQANNL